jgi:hypothetical protein
MINMEDIMLVQVEGKDYATRRKGGTKHDAYTRTRRQLRLRDIHNQQSDNFVQLGPSPGQKNKTLVLDQSRILKSPSKNHHPILGKL